MLQGPQVSLESMCKAFGPVLSPSPSLTSSFLTGMQSPLCYRVVAPVYIVVLGLNCPPACTSPFLLQADMLPLVSLTSSDWASGRMFVLWLRLRHCRHAQAYDCTSELCLRHSPNAPLHRACTYGHSVSTNATSSLTELPKHVLNFSPVSHV